MDLLPGTWTDGRFGRLEGSLVALLGVGLVAVHLGIVATYAVGPIWVAALMAAFPVVVSLGVVLLGFRLRRSASITSTVGVFGRWLFLGVLGQLLLTLWLAFVAEVLPPQGVVAPQYAVPVSVTVGVLYGGLLGYYQAETKQQTRALRERERELRRQNERLEEFTSVVSHDLQNPLNVAQGRLRGLSEDRKGDDLTAVERSVERMSTLISDLLELARTGEEVSDTEPVSLETSVRRAWETVETGGGRLSVEGDVSFEADPGRLAQLFENLFRNSVEHGGADVTVSVGPLEDGFYVADDGEGIQREARDQVMEYGVTTSEGGTGFGLAIVSGIARAHDWDVTVTEATDGGARFEFTGVTVSSPSQPAAARATF